MASSGAEWMGELLEVISKPVDAANIRDVAAKLEDINDDRPSDLNDRNAAIEKFQDNHAGSLKVCSFLNGVFKIKEKSRNSADEQYLLKVRMFIYNILLHLTSSSDLGNDIARRLVVSNVCELIRRDVNDNWKTASEIWYRWKMVEKGLVVLINTASHAAKGRYRNDWLSTVTSYARHDDHILVFLAESLSDQLGVTGRFPKVSADVITTWTKWLGKCENEDGSYYFHLPEPSTTTYRISSLFDSFSRVVKDDQKCALIQGLLPHCHHVENAITKGDEDDKRIITEVLTNLFTHNNCDICNLDFARDILVNSGKSVQEVVQLDPDSTNINDRFTWVAKQVHDKDTVCKLGSNLGLPLDTVKELITSNKDILAASTMEVLRLWDVRSDSSMLNARRHWKLLEALRVIKKGTNQEGKTLEPKEVPEQNNNEEPKAVTVTADHQVHPKNDVAEALNGADDQDAKPETPPATVKQEATGNHVQKEQKQQDVVPEQKNEEPKAVTVTVAVTDAADHQVDVKNECTNNEQINNEEPTAVTVTTVTDAADQQVDPKNESANDGMNEDKFDGQLYEIAEKMRHEDVTSIAMRIMNLGDPIVNAIENDNKTDVAKSYELFIRWKGITGAGIPELRTLLQQARTRGIPVNNEVFRLIDQATQPEQNNNEEPTAVTKTVAIADAADQQVDRANESTNTAAEALDNKSETPADTV